MIKKYYGYFVYNDQEYVIRFKVKGNLQWDNKRHCFVDKRWYIRSAKDLISLAAINTHWVNDCRFGVAYKLSYEDFKAERARGVKRWKPFNETIYWDNEDS